MGATFPRAGLFVGGEQAGRRFGENTQKQVPGQFPKVAGHQSKPDLEKPPQVHAGEEVATIEQESGPAQPGEEHAAGMQRHAVLWQH